jgi:hypothetical protein
LALEEAAALEQVDLVLTVAIQFLVLLQLL